MSIQDKTDSIAKGLLKPINVTGILILNTFSIIWGLWLASPFWTVFTRADVYMYLAAALGPYSEYIWGVIAIVCGLIALYGIIRPSRRSLMVGAAVMSLHWLLISTFYFLGDWQSTAGITTLCLAFYAAFVYLNIKVNGKNMQF